jgi:hypothetical protein
MSDYWYDPKEFDFDKEVEIDVKTDIDFDVDIKLEKNVDINVETNVKTDIQGNTAILVADVEAIGKDTFVEVFTSVLAVDNKLSSVTVEATAAAG